jgi:hypothetical protein
MGRWSITGLAVPKVEVQLHTLRRFSAWKSSRLKQVLDQENISDIIALDKSFQWG